MKPPRPRIHLKDTDSPILDYSNVEVRCQAVLKNAVTKFRDDWEDPRKAAESDTISRLDLCRKCDRAPESDVSNFPGKRYTYGLVEGQESRDAENLGASEGDNDNEPN